MHLLSRHPDVAVTIAFVLGQLSVLVPMLLLRSVPRDRELDSQAPVPRERSLSSAA